MGPILPFLKREAKRLTPHQQREAIKRRDKAEETLAEIGRSYNVSGSTISRAGGLIWKHFKHFILMSMILFRHH